MELPEYKDAALRTDLGSDEYAHAAERASQSARLLHAALGLATESGEIQDILKKQVFYGKPLDLVHLAEEIGDAMWYMAILLDELEQRASVGAGEVLRRNISKLRVRYPEKFSAEGSLERDLDQERRALEGGCGERGVDWP